MVDDNSLVLAVETAAANCHYSKMLLPLLEKTNIAHNTCIHADKAYCSQKHRDALRALRLKNGIQDKAVKNRSLSKGQLQRNKPITKARYVVERTFGSQARWFSSKMRYLGREKAHAWHILQAMVYNKKRLPKLFNDQQFIRQT